MDPLITVTISPEFINLNTVIRHMGEVKALEPFGVSVIVISLYTRGRLLETDVVEARETCPVDVLDRVVGNQEMLLPSHEHVVCLFQLLIVETVRVKVFRVLVKGKEFALKTATSLKLFPKNSKSLLLTQCFLSTSSSASHFLVRKGCLSVIISPSKKVTISGYSSVRFLIFKYPQMYAFSSSTF